LIDCCFTSIEQYFTYIHVEDYDIFKEGDS